MLKNGLKIKNPNFSNKQFIVDLELLYTNSVVEQITNIYSNNFFEVVKQDQDINYKNLKSFKITITVIDLIPVKYTLLNKINTDINFNSFKNNNIYIEFINLNNKLKCNCHILKNSNQIIFTPPNY